MVTRFSSDKAANKSAGHLRRFSREQSGGCVGVKVACVVVEIEVAAEEEGCEGVHDRLEGADTGKDEDGGKEGL